MIEEKKKKINILVSGSMVYDRIVNFPGYFKDHIMPDKIHILNVSFMVGEIKESYGGTAGNIAYNLSLLKEDSTIMSCVGSDFLSYKKWLSKNNIDISRIDVMKKHNTSSCHIITDKSDNQIASFSQGAAIRSSFSKNFLSYLSLKKKKRDCVAIVAPGNIDEMEKYVKAYKTQKIKYIFDPGQQITSLGSTILKRCINGAEALIGNDYEISLILNKTGWKIKDLTDRVKILIITRGENGSDIYAEKEKIIIPAVKLKKIVDPTGAGDAYRAGLIKGMIDNLPLKEIGRLANTVASFAVERKGTQNHKFATQDIEKRYKKNYK